mmetsp:Transcript_37152/g.148218  ORF Transcript_37152/g.148218 Transcript_37152/m.148218 type:complete len:120 (-) Transcript_37152:58-417(-)
MRRTTHKHMRAKTLAMAKRALKDDYFGQNGGSTLGLVSICVARMALYLHAGHLEASTKRFCAVFDTDNLRTLRAAVARSSSGAPDELFFALCRLVRSFHRESHLDCSQHSAEVQLKWCY